jgi:sugar phosphate isomerase/epimerase
MQIGIFAKTYSGVDVSTIARSAANADYTTLHFNLACMGWPAMPDTADHAALHEAGTFVRSLGLSIAGLSATYNMIHPDRAQRETGLHRLGILAAAAAHLGTRFLSLCTGTRHPTDQWAHHPENQSAAAWHDLIEAMEKALRIAEVHDVVLGIEPELANVVQDPHSARRLLDHFGSPRLKIILDPANLFEVADAAERTRLIETAIDMLAPDIAMAHAKDRAADGSFVAAGKGVVDFQHFFKRLKAAGFDGPMITHGLATDEAASVARFLIETDAAT